MSVKEFKKSRDVSLIFSFRRDIIIFRLPNLSRNKLEHHHEQAKRFHSNRASGSNRYHRTADVDPHAGPEPR